MSLYNVLHGFDTNAEKLIEIIGISPEKIDRFRDCFLNKAKNAIVVYTRTGGGNREYYQSNIDWLRSLPNYIDDYDDDYDCTYAHFLFQIPENYQDFIDSLPAPTMPYDKWKEFFEALKNE